MSASFELRWADLAKGRVPATLVIEHFDVIEQLHLRLAMTFEPLAEFALERREEALIRKIPDRPPVLVFAGVVERDGHITHGKTVVPSGNPRLDEHVVLKFLSLHFRRPGLLNDKPVRSFFVWKGTDASFLGGT